MNKIYGILAICILLSVIIQTVSATENKEYTCIDKKTVKSPPPTLDVSSGVTNIEKKVESLCPEGKVPKSDIDADMKDIGKDVSKMTEQLNQSTKSAFCTGGYCYHWSRSIQYVNNYGVSAYLTQHNPEVADIAVHSKAMISVADSALNQVAIGWRKGRYDSSPKLFVLWWRNGVPQCYNYYCGGWVQYSNYYYPGMTVSSGGTAPYTIYYYNGDWWMAYNGVWVGYYEGGYFSTAFDMANWAIYLGEVMNNIGPCINCFYTDMGNGLWASNPNAAKIYNQKYRIASNILNLWLDSKTTKSATSPNLYTVQDTGPNSMRYGGPGLSGSSVTPSIIVDYPNGGENLIRSTPTMISVYTINWRYNGQPGSNVRIDLYKGGVFNKVITSSTPIYIYSGGIGFYNWHIPYTQTLGSDYKIKITSTSNSAYNDWSNNYFTISDSNYIRVTSPNGGENWQRGTTKIITWTKSGNVGPYIKIELLKGGVLNRVISSSTANDGSYSWTIPSTQAYGTDYKVRITSIANSIYKDISNNNFKIY